MVKWCISTLAGGGGSQITHESHRTTAMQVTVNKSINDILEGYDIHSYTVTS